MTLLDDVVESAVQFTRIYLAAVQAMFYTIADVLHAILNDDIERTVLFALFVVLVAQRATDGMTGAIEAFVVVTLACAGYIGYYAQEHSDDEPTSDVVGPHILVPTDETIHYINGGEREDVTKWECKYCDWSGVHPDRMKTSISIQDSCDGFEWDPGELHAFEQRHETTTEEVEEEEV